MSASLRVFLLLVVVVAQARKQGYKKNNDHCLKNFNPVFYSLKDAYREQPLFVTLVQKTEENLLLDNICHTFFPLPDDPNTFQVYHSRVFCDGSTEIISYVGTVMEMGISRFGSPYCTYTTTVFGYAGCNTYLVYECHEFGDCGRGGEAGTAVYGLSSSCRSIGLSCLRKVEEVVQDTKIEARDFYVLPMRLPNRCVTQQICTNPSNPFTSLLDGIISTGRF